MSQQGIKGREIRVPRGSLVRLTPQSHLLGILLSAHCAMPLLPKTICSLSSIFRQDLGK